MKIVFYPLIKNEDVLADLYHRACWYLPDCTGYDVVFPVHRESLRFKDAPPSFGKCGPPQFNPVVKTLGDNPEVLGFLSTADFILLWDDDLNIMEKYNIGCVKKYVLNVSKASAAIRHEAYHFAILSHELMPQNERGNMLSDIQARFSTIVPQLTANNAYVFGTGPSLEKAMDMDFSNGVSIISNTIVKNKALVDHIRPSVIAAGDPALHYGVSKYACAFRENLLRVMDEHDCILVMPMGYYPLFIKRYPHLESRTYGLPIIPAKKENISLNLIERYEAACYANVLTMLLLPLAATFSKNVHIIGCDGRPPETISENIESPSPFWNHHKDSEQEALYDTLKICHPSFFSMNYQDWYEDHCRAIRTICEHGEKQGISFISSTPSFVPALAERQVQGKKEYSGETETGRNNEFEYRRDTRSRTDYKVSLIVSIYNADQFIIPALENLLSQTAYARNDMEIILIDSASPGNESGIIHFYMDRYEHIFYGRTWERETVYGAFNRAIQHSTGIYIMNLDTDNRLRNDAVDIFADYLDTHADVGLVYGNQYVSLHPNDSFYNSVRYGHLIRPEFSYDMMLHKFYFGSELMWRRELNEKVGLYDDTYVVAGDYEMVCRYATVTKFAHINKFYGLYMKNLKGVEYTNLPLCDREDDRIREQYRDAFPEAVDPPRVHIHYPLDNKRADEYLTIICHTVSYDQSIASYIYSIVDRLEFPYIIYCIDQNSSHTTRNSIDYLTGEGVVSSSDHLLPHARKLFLVPISYQPRIQFFMLAHGKVAAITEDFRAMKRPGLTEYFKQMYETLSKDFRDGEGRIDPVRVPTYCDHNEIMRIDLSPHQRIFPTGSFWEIEDNTVSVIIQHFAPEGQSEKYKNVLKKCIDSVRSQQCSLPIRIIVTDDGSSWSKGLVPEDAEHGIYAFGPDIVRNTPILDGLGVDGYLYKPRTGYFSKAILWNAALTLSRSDFFVFLDDDHSFESGECLEKYTAYFKQYPLVIGNTKVYQFRDSDGVTNSIDLDFNSNVVQGSNFGLTRELLDAIGGFEVNTFFWGTGDDPALFWKLFLKLRPTGDKTNFQACYVDDIVTRNEHSGRWSQSRRLDIALFIRDFMRRYGVHPNTNVSRNRSSWIHHIPARNPEPVQETIEHQAQTFANGQAEAISIVVPGIGADPQVVWETVSSILEQSLPECYRVYVVTNKESQTDVEGWMPDRVKIVRTDAETVAGAIREGIFSASGIYKGWFLPGSLMPPKTLKIVWTALTEGAVDIVSGSYCLAGKDMVQSYRQTPPVLKQEALLEWAGAWLPGQPVFCRNPVFSLLENVDFQNPLWDMAFIMKAAREFIHTACSHVFSVGPGINEKMEIKKTSAGELLSTLIPAQDLIAVINGAVSAFMAKTEVEALDGDEWQGFPWYLTAQRHFDVIKGLFKRLNNQKITTVVLYGAGEHTRTLIRAYWPRNILISCIFDDGMPVDDIEGYQVVLPSPKKTPTYDAVVLSSKKFEEQLYSRCRSLDIGPVFSIYNNFE